MRVGWLLSCRSKSSRHPGKSLDSFWEGFSIPQYIFSRLNKVLERKAIKDFDNLIVFVLPFSDKATPLSDSIIQHNIFYGSEDDLIKRNLDCALEYGFDYIVRVTCDDPFKDFTHAIEMLRIAIRQDLFVITNEHTNSKWIEGTTLEIYQTSFLRWLYFNSWTSYQREHIDFKNVVNISAPEKAKNIKLISSLSELYENDNQDMSIFSVTVDTKAQFKIAQELAFKLGSDYNYQDIKHHINNNYLIDKNNNTKSSHFPTLCRAENTRISINERKHLSSILESDLRGSKLYDSVGELEKEFSSLYSAKYAVAMCNGTHTLECSLRAIGIEPGDEVIVPNLTMAATCMSVLNVGAIPVFSDVSRETLQICPKDIIKNIGPRTKAIIVVSLFGGLPDLNEILKICNQNKIALLEDNAESMLSNFQGRPYGLVGDIASFSFQGTKHLTALEGGICITNDKKIALNLRRYSAVGYSTISLEKSSVDKNLIQNPNFDRHLIPATNSRMSPVIASIILGQLERVHHLVNLRIYISEMYDEVCKKHRDKVTIQKFYEESKSSYWGYPVILNDPNKWMKFRNIFISNGGLPFYAAWKLNSEEPAMDPDISENEITKLIGNESFRRYKINHHNISKKNSSFLQKRLFILRTNLWDYDVVYNQCKVLDFSLSVFDE